MAAEWVRRVAGPKLVLLAAAAVGVMAACDSKGGLTGVDAEVWPLVSVNGQPLPAAYPDPFLPPDVFQVKEGRLRVGVRDRSVELELTMQCHPDRSADECTVTGDGRQTLEGHHTANWDQVVLNDRILTAERTGDRIRITVQVPPGTGVVRPVYVLEFARLTTGS